MQKSGIYCIENLINGKKYIGQGKNVERRIKASHQNSTILLNAYKAYKKENFINYIILYCEPDELTYYEKECIKIFHSHFLENGYNISYGGPSPMEGRKHSESAKKKLSETHKGEKHWAYGSGILPEHLKNRKYKQGKDNPLFGRKFKNSSSKYYGVTSNIYGWDAFISIKGKCVYIGHSKDEIDAAKMYDKYVTENNLLNPLNFSNTEKLEEIADKLI